MTKKRFTVKLRQGATIYSITDYYGELPLSEGIYYKSNAEKLCKWLNTQHELLNAFCKENEQLKKSVNNLQDTIVTIGRAYQKKHGRTLVDLVDGPLEEDIIDLGMDL